MPQELRILVSTDKTDKIQINDDKTWVKISYKKYVENILRKILLLKIEMKIPLVFFIRFPYAFRADRSKPSLLIYCKTEDFEGGSRVYQKAVWKT